MAPHIYNTWASMSHTMWIIRRKRNRTTTFDCILWIRAIPRLAAIPLYGPSELVRGVRDDAAR